LNAIDLLKCQHAEVAALFARVHGAGRDTDLKRDLFDEIADKLAIHTAIEEHYFYPAVKAQRSETLLLESVQEHLQIKRELATLMDVDADDEVFEAKLMALQEDVEHHVHHEEDDLFPRVSRILNDEQLCALGQAMSQERDELEGRGQPRGPIPIQTASVATI
jgi:hemerythrin superfamily protein